MSFSDTVKKDFRILDIATERGFTVKHLSGSEYTLAEHDSIRINDEKNVFCRHSTEEKGSVIDFVMFAYDVDYKGALSFLRKKYSNDVYSCGARSGTERLPGMEIKKPAEVKHEPPTKKPFALPPIHQGKTERIYAYLMKTRKIHKDIVYDMVHRKLLYESEEENKKTGNTIYNAVFVGYDKGGKAVSAFKRSLYTNSGFKGLVYGSQNVGVYVKNESDTLIVSEAIIDCMSLMTMFMLSGKEYKKYDYLALCGKTIEPLIYRLETESGIKKIYVATDSDDAGMLIRKSITAQIKNIQIINLVPHRKDFNEDLIHFGEEKQYEKQN